MSRLALLRDRSIGRYEAEAVARARVDVQLGGTPAWFRRSA